MKTVAKADMKLLPRWNMQIRKYMKSDIPSETLRRAMTKRKQIVSSSGYYGELEGKHLNTNFSTQNIMTASLVHL